MPLPPVARARLLEREHELDALARVLAAAGRGGGQIAVMRGPPGAGKTSLMADTAPPRRAPA